MYLLLCKEEGSSPVSAIYERRDMGLYEMPLSMFLLCFEIGIMLALRAVSNILVRNASPRGPMCRDHHRDYSKYISDKNIFHSIHFHVYNSTIRVNPLKNECRQFYL